MTDDSDTENSDRCARRRRARTGDGTAADSGYEYMSTPEILKIKN
jgi:hypothetical protein